MRVIWSAVLLLGPDSNLATPTSDCSPTSSQSGPVPLFGSGLPTPVVLPARAPGAYVASPPAAPDPEPERALHARRRLELEDLGSVSDRVDNEDSADDDSDDRSAAVPAIPVPVLYDSSDDDMAAAIDAPRFARGHATYGDAEHFCRKVGRILRSGKYDAYTLQQKIAQLAIYCDDTTAGRLDRLTDEGGVMVGKVLHKWTRQLGYPAGADGEDAVPAVAAATLEDLLNWFVLTFSRKDVVRAAKKRLQSSFGQTTLLDAHFEQIVRDVKAIKGSMEDDSQVDNILASLSCYTVDELVGYKGLGAVARDHHANPNTRDQIDTGTKLKEWLLGQEEAYIEAAETVGAAQYWIGFKDRKLQTHPKRSGKQVNAIFDDPKVTKMEQRQEKMEAQLVEVQQAQANTTQEVKSTQQDVLTLGDKITSWQVDSDKKQDEVISMLRKGQGRQGKGQQGNSSWPRQGLGGGPRQATYQSGRGGGMQPNYDRNGFAQGAKGGQGGGQGGAQRWNPRGNTRPWQQQQQKPVPAHIACFNCGGNHFARDCTAQPNEQDSSLQRRVNAIADSLHGDGPIAAEEIETQFESRECAQQWIAHVREKTAQMVQFAEASRTGDTLLQVQDMPQEQQPGGYYEQVNAVNGTSSLSPIPVLTTDTQAGVTGPNKTTVTTTGATGSPKPVEHSFTGLNKSWTAQKHDSTDSSSLALSVQIQDRWVRVLNGRLTRWKKRFKRRGAVRKAKEQKTVDAEQDRRVHACCKALTHCATAGKDTFHEEPYSERPTRKIIAGNQPQMVCGVEQQKANEPATEIRRTLHPRVVKPSMKTTAACVTLTWILISMASAFTVAAVPEGAMQTGAFAATAAGASAFMTAFGCWNDRCYAANAVFPPLITALLMSVHGQGGYSADSMVRHLTSESSQRITGWCGSFGGSCVDHLRTQSIPALQHIRGTQWAHLTMMIIALLYIKWHSSSTEKQLRQQKIKKLIAAQAVEDAKAFSSAYVEIELVDEPGRIIKVLLDLGASCSVLSRRSLRGVYHKLIRKPPAARLIGANGLSLGLACGIVSLRFRFAGHDEIYEHNVEVIDNDGVPCIFGVD